VLELRPRPRRFTVNEHGPGPVVLRFSDLRDELIPSVFRNIKRDVDARPDTFALEEQNVLSPEDLFLDGDLPLCGDGVVRAIFTTNAGEFTYVVEKDGVLDFVDEAKLSRQPEPALAAYH